MSFLETDLKTSLPRTFTFATPDKVRELAERGGGLKKMADRQAFEYAVSIGRAGQYAMRLWVKPDQLAKLGITVSDISNAIQAQNTVNTLASISS